MDLEEQKKVTRVLPVLRAYIKALSIYPLLVLLVLLATLVIEGMAVLAPLYIRDFINIISSGIPTPTTTQTLVWILCIYALIQLAGWIGRRGQMFSMSCLETKVMSDLSNNAFAYLLGHSHDFFISNFAGTLTKRVNRYARAFEQLFDSVIFSFFATALFALGILIVLFKKSFLIGAGLLIWTVLFVAMQVLMARARQPLRVLRAAEDSNVTGVLSDAVSNQSTISLFAATTYERSVFGKAIEKWRIATMRSWTADDWILAIQGILAIVVQVGILYISVLLWERGLLTVGDFVLIQVYILALIDKLWGIGSNMRKVYDSFADAYEMIEIFETPHAIQDKSEAQILSVPEGGIAVKDVLFNFNETRPILEKFSLHIAPHEKVALVGPSGAGKSTVTKLLLRFYDVTSGSIEIDAQDIRSVTQDSLREAIAFVPQEPILFHRSLMDNIRYGSKHATDEEVYEAARKAHCHEFIEQLPLQYETFVGERGVKLSGGERQRVAIARAILKNAPILILDEATSSLDSESESLIQEALHVLMQGKTVIVIAHRLSTIMTMDRIVVIENGRVEAQGTHEELLDQKGSLYHTLWSIQAGSFLADEIKEGI